MSWIKRFFGIKEVTRPANSKMHQPPNSIKENLAALKNIPRFLKLIWETSPAMMTGNIFLRLLKAAIPVTMLFIAKLIIDEVILLTGAEGANASTTFLWQMVILEFALGIFSEMLNRGIALLDALLGDLVANETSVRLIRHAANLDLPKFEDAEFYDKLERARRQTVGRVTLMSQILVQAQDFITILFLAAGLIIFNPWLILLLCVAVIPSFLSENYFNKNRYSITRNWTSERRELDYIRYIGASDITAKEIKVFGLGDFLADRFELLADQYYKVNKKLSVKQSFWGTIFNTLGTAGYYAAYVLIIMQAITKVITVGDLTFLAGSFNRLRNLLQGMLIRFSRISESALYLQDLFDFFDIQPTIRSKEKALPIPETIKEGFVFHNVGFKYPGSEIWALRGVSFTLHAGEKLALVGENGAGKTTLTKLLSRLYDPSEGYITLEGKDLREYDLNGLRRLVGVIFQDFVRFQMKADENIAVGHIAHKEEFDRIENAAVQSLAVHVIEKLPEQYQQMLGKRFAGGVDLSGGEWQKIALARAYMRDTQLLILDEPTAALDARAEYEVFQRFSELTKGKSAVLISHRFSTVRMADRILVLKNGQQEELGTHEELLASEGLYAELFLLQAQGYM